MTKHIDLYSIEVSTETPVVVYGHPGSGCTQKVLTILAEKGIEAEVVVIDMSKGEHKAPEHVARQPFGVIPAIQIDGFVMYESRAIVRYIDQRYPDKPLTPVGRRARALMEQFLSVEYSYFSPGIGKIFMNSVVFPMVGAPVDAAAIEKGREEVRRVFGVLEAHLAEHAYLAGDRFSLAEVDFLPGLFALKLSKADDVLEDYPHVGDWVSRITARPSWQKVMGMIQWG